MSFLYEMFHIPQTLDELIDKATIYRENRVDVYIKDNYVFNLGRLIALKSPVAYKIEYGVRTKKNRVAIDKFTEDVSLINSNEAVLDNMRTLNVYYDEAILLADMLDRMGFNTSINNKPVERLKQIRNFHEMKISKLEEELA